MIIGGIQKFSLVDYPGYPSAVLFVLGCNMRCGYCHNPELVLPEKFAEPIELSWIYRFLERRKKLLEGVVITGGEPTLKKALPVVAEKIKSMGFRVKLDTNGTNPNMLNNLLEQHLVDYIAMDIKGPLERYDEITNRSINKEAIKESINLIMNSKIQHEFRTTTVKGQLDLEDFVKIGKLICGADRYYIQKFVSTKTLLPEFEGRKPFTQDKLDKVAKTMRNYVQVCEVR